MPKLSPVYNEAQFISGIPANGAKVFTYAAGSSTKLATYTDDTGATPQANPIILNARGEPASPIWLADGLSYKFVFTASTDSDPPVSPIRTIDDVTGINDASVTIDQWVDSGVTPTYVSATSFTVPGDQATAFHVGRRIKAAVTAGTAYGRISVSVFAALTTVTVVLDSGALDSGLSIVQLGLLTTDNPSIPVIKDNIFRVSGSSDKTKLFAVEVDGITTNTTRIMTIPDKDFTPATTLDIPYINDFRLTLLTGVPITVSDLVGISTVYCTPYIGNKISLYNGTTWNVRSSVEFSIALSGLVSGRPYDVFCYDNASVPTLELLAWTNDTTRATALVTQDGVLVKSGDATRKYIGSIYTTSATTTEDSLTSRYLWNNYNRVSRPMQRRESTASWTYTTATWRQANASTSNQLNFMMGRPGDKITAAVASSAQNTSAAVTCLVSVGLDSTTTPAGIYPVLNMTANNQYFGVSANYTASTGAGRHFMAWLEFSTATGTTTWAGTAIGQSGIIGEVFG